MGLVSESDVGKLLHDDGFMDQVVAGLVEDSTTMDALADDIADKVQDALEDNSELRQRLISAAVTNQAFKKKLISKLVDDLG